MAADQTMSGNNGMSRAKIVEALQKLFESKNNASYEAQVKDRAVKGDLVIKGQTITLDIVNDALEQKQQASGASAPAPSAPGGERWTPTSSAGAMANRAAMEHEDAETYNETVQVTCGTGGKVAVLTKPDVTGAVTGEYIAASDGMVEVVSRVINRKDGRVYVRLRTKTGWVSTRSRKEFSKVVLEIAEGRPALEPPSIQAISNPRATRYLQPVDEAGKPTGAEATLGGEPRRFRATAMVPILAKPDFAGEKTLVGGARLSQKQEFVADGAFLRAADGRAWLHLKDGTGWVCERNKTDFSRMVVEPCGPSDDFVDDGKEGASGSQSRVRSAGGKKVIVTEKKELVVPVEAVGNNASVPGGISVGALPQELVFRSDLEIWPEELRPPKPLDKNMRVKLRRIFASFGVKSKECEEDIAEIDEKAKSFNRACPAQKELQQYAEQLKKEMQKVQKEWTAAVKAALAGSSVPSKAPTPPADAKDTSGCSIMPVQVRGSRWFCASVGGRPAPGGTDGDEDGGSGAASTGSVFRHIGPLRLSEDDASADLSKMMDVKGTKRKDADDSKDSEPAAKRAKSKKAGA